MNKKFYSLPKDRQLRIINAGFLVFSQNTYKKSPMQEIAGQAGISKSLLFHYFRNKRELYLFLWDQACRTTMRYLQEHRCYDSGDLFEMMERGMYAKIGMMKKYPNVASFAIRAFFEDDEQIAKAIQESYRKYFDVKVHDALSRLDPEQFIPGLDLEEMYHEIYLASEGYLWEALRQGGSLDAEKLEKDFERMLAFWKHVYLRKEE